MFYTDTEARRQLCRERADELAREVRRARGPTDPNAPKRTPAKEVRVVLAARA